jgi:hypothetical protein
MFFVDSVRVRGHHGYRQSVDATGFLRRVSKFDVVTKG